MKIRIILCLLLVFSPMNFLVAQTARFSYFKYTGMDQRFEQDINPEYQYFNPVIAGFYPDPSICRKGDTYYLANSTFAFFPGVPLFKSDDLVAWKQVGHILDRDSQVSLGNCDVSAGIFAPAISYCPKNNTFYMVTMNMANYTVFYVKSQNPEKGWSEPILLKSGGMDPSFFFDDDGRSYMVYTTRPRDGQRYPGEMAIYMNEFYPENDSLQSEATLLVRGGSNPANHPKWLEGPHLYKRNGYYYLMCAEGGTTDGHTEVVFRSKQLVGGSWESNPANPILSQCGLENIPNPVSSTGHADLIQTSESDWWAVFLGCRPYEEGLYNTGRETFLLPVSWKDDWPIILDKGKPVPVINTKQKLKKKNPRPTGNFCYIDRFDGNQLDMRWMYLRNPNKSYYRINDNGLSISANNHQIGDKPSPTALFCRQQHTCFSAETELYFLPTSAKEIAGITLFQNESHYIILGVTLKEGCPTLVLQRAEGEMEEIASVSVSIGLDRYIRLRIDGSGRLYNFYYQSPDGSWNTVAKDVDASLLSTKKAGGFVGTTIGLFVSKCP